MGHLVGKDIYKNLGQKIDSLNVSVPWNDTFHAILKELYSPEEAELIVKMPAALSTFADVQRVTRLEPTQLRNRLDALCAKGLAVDIFVNDDYYYIPSPLVIGIFEFTMMRTDKNLDIKTISRLFHRYMNDESFYKANFGGNEKMGLMRALPYEESISGGVPGEADYVEILDYEKAAAIVEQANRFSVGYCSCRHEKLHADAKTCDVPLDTCSSFGYSADYLIRNNLAREVSKSEMLDNIARSKELGLVLNADNIRKNNQFICHCCKCCCNVLLGVSRFGCPNIVVTSSFIIDPRHDKCVGCGRCVAACPVEAIRLETADSGTGTPRTQSDEKRAKKNIHINTSICIGCGVCVPNCKPKALQLIKRKQRVLHPETTFENAILKCLERGTLQDQIFENPNRIDQKVMRGIVGGFLKLPPVKRALMGDTLRSIFFNVLRKAARLQGKGWVTEL